MRHMLTLDDYAKNEILEIIDLGIDLKKNRDLDVAMDVPENYFARPVVDFRGLGDLEVV